MYFDEARRVGLWTGRNNKISTCLDEIIRTNNLSDRKGILTGESDIPDDLQEKGFSHRLMSTYYEIANSFEELINKI